MLDDINLHLPRLVLRIVLEALVVVSAYSEHIFWAINVIAEIDIVNLVHIAHIHVVL